MGTRRIRRVLFAAAMTASWVMLPVTGGRAATPGSGTVNDTARSVAWSGPAKTASTNTVGLTQTDIDASCSLPGAFCDDYALTAGFTADYWKTHAGGVTVSVTWSLSSDDFDLYVFDPSGNIVASSGQSNTTSEVTTIPSAVGPYTVRVVYFGTTNAGYNATAVADAVSTTVSPQTTVPPGTPTFFNYTSPPDLGNDWGEPSIGVDWKTGKVMMGATDASDIPTQTLRVTFDDCSSPAAATWENKPVPTGVTTNDTILFVDHTPAGQPDRCIDSKLIAGTKQSLAGFSDNDGDSWTVSTGSGLNSGVDHQTLGAGPYHAGGAVVPGTYPHAWYYCAQDSADANCARSDNGGQTFGPAIPIYTRDQCTGIHGHVKVAPDGTVYVPNKNCHDLTTSAGVTDRSGAAVVRSEDNGLTWKLGAVPPGATGGGSWDPSVGIGADGTIYMGYENADGHARVAVSHDKGDTWVSDTDVGAPLGIKTIAFPAAVAGDGDRASVAYLGTAAPGDSTDITNFHGAWYLFVSTTLDGGKTWNTVNATPNDPVQRGSICTSGTTCNSAPNDRNLLDFIDATVDAQGRVLIGYADGCVGGCVAGTDNSYTAKAVIARQASGKRLFAANDPALTTPPAAPAVTATKDALGVVHLAWTPPDPGSSPILGYHVYRRTPSGTYGAPIATTATNKFDDDTGGVDYVYEVRAFNAVGEGSACKEIASASVPLEEGACARPGIGVLKDVSGDELDMVAGHDVEALAIAEPYLGAGQNKIVFSLKVADLSTLPPATTWPIDLTGGDGKGYIVEMVTDPTGAVSFKYGTLVVNPDGTYGATTIVGDADPSSAYTADGVITIILDAAKVGSPNAGQKLTKFLVRVAVSAGAGPTPTPDNMPGDLTPQGVYTRVGNEACRPNNAPLAVLTGLPLDGDPPLHVAFDASGSKDQDGDPITAYTFRFGDGTAAVTQTTPTVSHTYKTKGEYPATLTVKDARGFVSVNPAAVQVVAGEHEGAESGKLPATGPSEGPTSAGHGVGSLIVAFCAVAGLAGMGIARRSRLVTRRT